MSGRHGGAHAPPGFGWQAGKTAASIRFVREAEAMLQDPSVVLRREVADALIDYATKVKSGEIELEDWLSVSEFLSRT